MSQLQLIAVNAKQSFIGYSNTFTSTNNITAPDGATYVTITMLADGGDGGDQATVSLGPGSVTSGGGGGGGGGLSEYVNYPVTGGVTNFSFTIGSGVTLTTPSMEVFAGGDGSTSTNPYEVQPPGGTGGGASGGTTTTPGGAGEPGNYGIGDPPGPFNGAGGSPNGGSAGNPGNPGTNNHYIEFAWS